MAFPLASLQLCVSSFLKPGKDGCSSGQYTAVYEHMERLAGASAIAEIAVGAKVRVILSQRFVLTV